MWRRISALLLALCFQSGAQSIASLLALRFQPDERISPPRPVLGLELRVSRSLSPVLRLWRQSRSAAPLTSLASGIGVARPRVLQ
eukprot:759506-Rhodomonas_salina.1